MKLLVLASVLLLSFPVSLTAAQTAPKAQNFSPSSRTFRFTYNSQ